MKFFPLFKSIIAITILFFSASEARELLVKTPSGESLVMEIEPNDTFFNVIEQIETSIEIPQEHLVARGADFCLDYSFSGIGLIECSSSSSARNYNASVSSSEKQDIGYIVKTLAKSSIPSLLIHKGDLERAGDRINHVHPFKWLYTIFSDEELKVGVRNIRSSSWIWNKFMEGSRGSLTEEAGRNNLEQHIDSFAASLGIKGSQLRPLILAHKWDDLVDLLITLLPRKGDVNRYDM